MANRRIAISDMVIGQPLQWDAYGGDGTLLLRKGFVINNEHQITELIDRGLFADIEFGDGAGRDKKPIPKQIEIPSVVRMVNAARVDLRVLSYNIAAETDARSKFLVIANLVVNAMQVDADVALGCILLSQEESYAPRHCVDTAIVSLLIARALRKPIEEQVMLCAAALTMNLSMLRQQERLQDKAEALSAEEKEMIFRHPENTIAQLRKVGIEDENWLSWILHHHENHDGSGYPGKKSGADTPQNAKIIAIADRYCSRVCSRTYRRGILPNAALRDILNAGKTTIDPMLVMLFIRELGTYPIGSCVKLENGEVGVVTSKGSTTTTPYVHTLIGPRGEPFTSSVKRNTQKTLHSIREVLYQDQLQFKFTMRQLWGEVASL
jgi:HD-GYP domain-containing protein (c-di-GMP phosphodiesterase class II)